MDSIFVVTMIYSLYVLPLAYRHIQWAAVKRSAGWLSLKLCRRSLFGATFSSHGSSGPGLLAFNLFCPNLLHSIYLLYGMYHIALYIYRGVYVRGLYNRLQETKALRQFGSLAMLVSKNKLYY